MRESGLPDLATVSSLPKIRKVFQHDTQIPGKRKDAGTALLLALSWTALQPLPARARAPESVDRRQPHVTVVRRGGCPHYEKVVEEFRGRTRAAVTVLTARPGAGAALRRRLGRSRPDLLLAVGQTAYDLVREENTPVVHAVVYHRVLPKHHGVPARVPARIVLATFRRARPELRHVGVLHGPDSAGALAGARDAAARLDVKLIDLPATSPAEAIGVLRRMDRRVQGLWLLADLQVLTPQVFQYALGLQLRRGVPLMGVVARHVRQGALFALQYDPHDVGRRAARLTTWLLGGKRPAPQRPGTPHLYVNRTTAGSIAVPVRAFRGLSATFVH